MKLSINKNNIITLQEAKQLNNTVKSDFGWVYNKFVVIEDAQREVLPTDSNEEILQKFEEFRARYNTERQRTEKLDNCWELHPIERFDSSEQITYLIEKGEFYYAPFND